MKRIFLFFYFTGFFSGIYSQTLFTYGNNAVSKYEFLRAYNKNKTTVTDKALALREYLDLYLKFKLKVKAAKDLRIDTLASIATDLQNFRTQIEESYLNDESQVNALTQEAFDRSQKDIRVAYIFYSFTDNPDSISVVQKHAITKAEWSDLGFITVFSLPYQIENVVYKLNPKEESKLVRTKNGFYIFKNVGEREAAGKMKAAQILVAISEGAKEEDNISARKLADSAYNALIKGADFGEVAKSISNDQTTYMSGGLMPEFGVGKYSPDFENKVFALQKDGDITPPFKTTFGYHIVKRISKIDVPKDKNSDSYLYTLKQQVLQDSRISSAKQKFINDVLKKLNYKKYSAIYENDLWKLTDSFIVTNKMQGRISGQTPLFSINNQNFKIADWLAYVKDYKASGTFKGELYSELLNNYVSVKALENYKKRLADFNPEFKYQIQEFKDGNMLFEVMERNVWNKASNDEAGLKNYYNQNKTKYTWNESADAILISSSNVKAATDAVTQFKNGKSWKKVAEENSSQIQTDSGRYEFTQLPAKLNANFINGMITDPLVNETDGTATFVKIIKLYPTNQQRSFEEARGLVINDFQTFLEEKWIALLKKKYPVKVNEKIFQSLL